MYVICRNCVKYLSNSQKMGRKMWFWRTLPGYVRGHLSPCTPSLRLCMDWIWNGQWTCESVSVEGKAVVAYFFVTYICISLCDSFKVYLATNILSWLSEEIDNIPDLSMLEMKFHPSECSLTSHNNTRVLASEKFIHEQNIC